PYMLPYKKKKTLVLWAFRARRPITGIAGCCARRERPSCRRPAEKRDEIAPLHVSRATVWRSLSGWLAAHSGYHRGTGRVLGADLNRSESPLSPQTPTSARL